MTEFEQQDTARKFEITMQAAVRSGLNFDNVYRGTEEPTRILPCAVMEARATGEDESMRIDNRYATTLAFRATAMVSAAQENSAQALETFARSLKIAIETASDIEGWNYVRLDYQGDERAFDGVKRECVHLYTVTVHPI